MKNKLLIMLLMLGMSSALHAETIEIHDKSELFLGNGVNPLTERGFKKCIQHDPKEVYQDGSSSLPIGEVSAVDLPVRIEHITSYEQMSKYSSSSMSAGVSYAFVSASLSRSEQKGSSMFSDSASVGLDMSADYGRFALTNVRLKPEYAKLAQENREAFYKECGTEYIVGYRLGQGIRVKMSTSANSSASYSRVKTAVGVAVSTGAIGGSLAGQFENAASSLMTASALEINIFTYGAGPLKNIESVLKTENDAVKFRDRIADYVGRLKPQYAVKTHFITQPYFPGDNTYDPLLTEIKKRSVRSLYSDFLMLLSHKERIENAVRGGKLRKYLGNICSVKPNECNQYIDTMESENEWVATELEDIRKRAITCIEGKAVSDCKTKPEVHVMFQRLQSIIWPIHYRYKLMQSYLDEIRERDGTEPRP